MPSPDVDEPGRIPFGLGEDLERTLATLAGMPSAAAEASVALLPFGDRVRLASYGIIDAEPDREMADAGWPSDFAITSDGWRVIESCASRWASEAVEVERPELADDERARLNEQLDEAFEQTFGHAQPHSAPR